jgi:hypothetical protein
MKKINKWWYVAGVAGGLASFVAYQAYIKNKHRSQTKGEILRRIITNQAWYVSKIKETLSSEIQKNDTWALFENGMVLDLGLKESLTPEQREYDNLGSWFFAGKYIEVKWQGPACFSAYKWELIVLKTNKLRLLNTSGSGYLELTALLDHKL